jgi:hypothetical protein
MAERRPLIAGLQKSPEPDPDLEKQFVYGDKRKTDATPAQNPTPENVEAKNRTGMNRVPLTTRVRIDFAHALKRASLERQLKGEFPHTLQDILEEALEPWLKNNGYIT